MVLCIRLIRVCFSWLVFMFIVIDGLGFSCIGWCVFRCVILFSKFGNVIVLGCGGGRWVSWL